ncbi:MAG: vitamin B12 dependent-methionine synthase activation domain-containing protein [Bacteroidales bacterium]
MYCGEPDVADLEIRNNRFVGEIRSNNNPEVVLNFLRSQERKEAGVHNLCLADFVAPEESGITDYTGLFVVTAETDEEKMKEYASDDYSTIMIRILCDRLAEPLPSLSMKR